MTTPLIERPRPLAEAAALWGRLVAAGGGLITALVSAGVLTADQGSMFSSTFTALDGVVVAIIALVTVAGPLLASLGILKQAEPQVTPVIDPATVVDGELVSLTPEAAPRHQLGG